MTAVVLITTREVDGIYYAVNTDESPPLVVWHKFVSFKNPRKPDPYRPEFHEALAEQERVARAFIDGTDRRKACDR